MVRTPPLPSPPHLTNPHHPDTASKLPYLDSQSTGLLNFQHQPPRNPFLCPLHPTTPILDLYLRENQPTVLGRTDEPGVGDPPVNRARDAAT